MKIEEFGINYDYINPTYLAYNKDLDIGALTRNKHPRVEGADILRVPIGKHALGDRDVFIFPSAWGDSDLLVAYRIARRAHSNGYESGIRSMKDDFAELIGVKREED